MSDRSSYEKLSTEQFTREMTNNIFSFVVNMHNLGTKAMSFPEWYETFAAWLEVGTNEEEMMYHRYECCSNKECKLCLK